MGIDVEEREKKEKPGKKDAIFCIGDILVRHATYLVTAVHSKLRIIGIVAKHIRSFFTSFYTAYGRSPISHCRWSGLMGMGNTRIFV